MQDKFERFGVSLSPGHTPETNLIDQLEQQFGSYLALDAGTPLVLALWTLATHVYQQFSAFPYLGVLSPVRECGKTRLLEIIELFAHRPYRRISLTPAGLFRRIDQNSPTLLIDEAQAIGSKSNQALKEILDSGYRQGAIVERVGLRGKLVEYKTFCPKAIALIGELPETLASRTISIRMQRMLQTDSIDKRLPEPDDSYVVGLHKASEEWAETERDQIKRAYKEHEPLEFAKGREAERWIPLFVVCELVAPHRFGDLTEVAIRLATAKKELAPVSHGIRALTDIRGIFDPMEVQQLPTATLIEELQCGGFGVGSSQRYPARGTPPTLFD